MPRGVAGEVSVRLLGPVEVVVADRPQAVSGLRRRAVLATLALHPGRVVSTDRLIDVVWGDRPPTTALNTLQRHVSHLRGLLGGPGTIVARPPGYLLDTGPETTDVEAAERLLDRAKRSGDPAEQSAFLQAAVALWRGQPLADVAGLSWLDEQAEHLGRLRLEVERALAEARLSIGDHAQLIPELERLVRQHPFDEQLHAQLMLALYRTGRQGEAVATFRRLCDSLDEHLGIDPSPQLRDLELAILRQDPAIGAPAPGATPAPGTVPAQLPPVVMPAQPSPVVVPAQLPPVVPTFAGRGAEVAILDGLLHGGGTVVVSGTAGVGKTALAVQWAHRVAAKFPDGQLYANLRGFDPAATPTDPARVLRGFLEALGVPAAQLSSDLDTLASLFRSKVAGRQVLVVLDNARDAEQVRPLLPGSSSCLAVVTSRSQLTPLVVAESAYPLVLDLLTLDEAREMLARRLGAHRVAAEPAAADGIIDRCARLPLALAIVAARAAINPSFPLSTVATQVRDAGGGLDAFYGGDETTDVRAVFSWSCRTLSADAARLFRLLSLHPGPDVTTRAAASLAGAAPARIGAPLAELTRANLLAEHSVARYTFHDLLRAHAADLAGTAEAPADRRAAVHRLLDHWLHTAHAADLALHPHFSEVSLAPPQEGVLPERPGSRSDATAWFTAELAVLLAAVPYAAQSGFEGHAWRLVWSMSGFLARSGHWQDWLAIGHIALAAASRTGDRIGQGHTHRNLALACSRLGRQDEARDHLLRALKLFDVCGEEAAQAHTYLNLGQITERQGEHRRALDYSRQALALFQRAGARAGQAYTLNAVGWQESLLGQHQRALASCEAALALLQEVDDVQGQADTWDSLGYAHHQLGNHRRAVACYDHALELFSQVNDSYAEAGTYVNIGNSYQALGDTAATRTAWGRAIAILDRLGHADAERVRADLDLLDATA